ncbi:MAG: hypothetical protein HY958_06350 [Bacteroidia bacterium]|nr:hypothetical protein [Bacteroidia bacterium]
MSSLLVKDKISYDKNGIWESKTDYSGTRTTLIVIGSLTSLTGIIFSIEAINHVGKAGKLLIEVSGNGVTAAIKF